MAARSFWDSFLTLLFGDAAHPEAARPLLGAPMLSNWLPYRSFDAKSRMFINTESVGFILELAPMVGADEVSVYYLDTSSCTYYIDGNKAYPSCLVYATAGGAAPDGGASPRGERLGSARRG